MAIIVVPLMEVSEVQRYLERQLVEDKDGDRGAFASVLDLDLSHFDDRATLQGIRITNVEEIDGVLGVSYTVDYHVYHGCKDIDGSGEWECHVSGVRTSDGWEFEENVPIPKRTTLDEF